LPSRPYGRVYLLAALRAWSRRDSTVGQPLQPARFKTGNFPAPVIRRSADGHTFARRAGHAKATLSRSGRLAGCGHRLRYVFQLVIIGCGPAEETDRRDSHPDERIVITAAIEPVRVGAVVAHVIGMDWRTESRYSAALAAVLIMQPLRGPTMGYVEKHLMNGENIVYRARLHYFVFLLPVAIAVSGLILALLIWRFSENGPAAAIVAASFLIVSLLLAVPRFIRYRTSEFAITNKRVVVKVGLVHRHTLELVLAKLETIGVDQSVPGRIFNYGTIVVTGTGGTQEAFREIANPIEFRKHVQSELDQYGRSSRP